jgi:hypothetical protein
VVPYVTLTILSLLCLLLFLRFFRDTPARRVFQNSGEEFVSQAGHGQTAPFRLVVESFDDGKRDGRHVMPWSHTKVYNAERRGVACCLAAIPLSANPFTVVNGPGMEGIQL